MSRGKVIPAQAPQYRQYALISDLLDLAKLSIQDEAALATHWTKDRPEGLKLRNLALATRTGRRRPHAINKCESLGLGKLLNLLRRHFFAECALPVLYVTSGHPRSRF